MGKIKQGILGPVEGKVGSVVGGVWKGIAYLRGLATSHADSQTQGQLQQRQKFSIISGFLQPMSEFLQIGFRAYAVGMTGINAAFAYNIRNAISGAYPNFAVDYTNALVSRGNLAGALNQAAAAGAAGTVVYTWDDNSTEIGASALDKTMIVVYNPVKHQAVTVDGLAERAVGTQTITVPDSWSGDAVQTYLAFKNAENVNSNSGFAGAVTVV